jgi:8-oxo-dGTP pyrophosphatase MutT (NUDIX family)
MVEEYLQRKAVNKQTAVTAFFVRDGRVLVGLRHYTPDKWQTISVWTCPGGRCDIGETLGETLLRETEEETGINDTEILEVLGEIPGSKEGDVVHMFLCRTSQEARLLEPEKFSEWKWVPLHEMPDDFINPPAFKLVQERFASKS